MKELIEQVSVFYKEYITVIHIAAGALIFLLALIIRNKVSGGLLSLIAKLIFRKDEEKRSSLKSSLQRPLSLFLLCTGLFFAVYLNVRKYSVVKCYKIAAILIICWAIVNYLSENLHLFLHLSGDRNDSINITAIKFINNILKILIIAFAVVMIISEFGYNINGLITGLGVGGLAVSLAAQDAVSNMISGFIIVLEKPFIVGEFIQTKSIMGTVEEVSMRSTKIRTIEDTLVTLPNNTLTADAIINISRMSKRLINFDIALTYSTSNELMEKCQSEIKDYLKNNEMILEYPLRVEFSKLDDSSLNLNIYCYTSETDIHRFQTVLSDINYEVKKIVEANGAEFAFPSSSIYIEKK